MCPFSQINNRLMITLNKGRGLITGITATASYLLHSYSKENQTKQKPLKKPPKTHQQKNPKTTHQFAYFYYEPAKQKT